MGPNAKNTEILNTTRTFATKQEMMPLPAEDLGHDMMTDLFGGSDCWQLFGTAEPTRAAAEILSLWLLDRVQVIIRPEIN